ncbi:MAG: SDR family NAD(P)-dependent oxidoreductase [Bacteroidetes bacterium]|nr:SDR family NAD(P)-dependent oxidoreductase [Bacteroidota bacterium]
MFKSISIIGCGWLGLALGKELATSGMQVKGSTTSPDKMNKLEKEGIIPFLIDIKGEGIMGETSDFLESEVLFINIPPGRKNINVVVDFNQKLELLIRSIESLGHQYKQVYFISSSSVYPANNDVVNEQDARNPESKSGEALLLAEQRMIAVFGKKLSIIRFGGLVDEGRDPVKFFSGRKGISGGDSPVNLIHKKDCIAILQHLLKTPQSSYRIYNAACPKHPSRKTYYTFAANYYNMEIPLFDPKKAEPYKIVCPEKLICETNYQFKYKSPLDWLA